MSQQPYYRTDAQKAHDRRISREYEEYVAGVMGPNIITRFDAQDDLDIWRPALFIDIKEKNQPYGRRWQQAAPHIPEEHLFILDELSVRRALRHYPEAFFLIRNRTNTDLRIAPIWEVIAVERVRVNRVGKGKWLVDLRHFRQLATEADIEPICASLLASTEWKKSECLTQMEVPQI